MSFCSNCGKELQGNSSFCPACGKAVGAPCAPAADAQSSGVGNGYAPQSAHYQPQGAQYRPPQYQPPQYYAPQQYYKPPKDIVHQLADKVKIQAVIWCIVACLQYILGIVYIVLNCDLYNDSEVFGFIMGFLMLAVAGANTAFCVREFKYCNEVLIHPVGIVAKYSPVGNIIATLIYNILFGGVIGVVGSIYAFFVRGFVKNNENQFIELEYRLCTPSGSSGNSGADM